VEESANTPQNVRFECFKARRFVDSNLGYEVDWDYSLCHHVQVRLGQVGAQHL
jgi:hypothetical protein